MKTIWKVLIAIVAIVIVCVIGYLVYMKTAFLSKDEIKEIVVEDTNLSEKDIYFESIELEMDEKTYDVSIYYNNNEYEYKIDAKEGKIIYTDFINPNNTNKANIQSNDNTNNNVNNNEQTTEEITLEDAKKIAFDHINVNESNVTIKKANSELDDGIEVYEIEFIYNSNDYDFTIAKSNGEIINYDKEPIR